MSRAGRVRMAVVAGVAVVAVAGGALAWNATHGSKKPTDTQTYRVTFAATSTQDQTVAVLGKGTCTTKSGGCTLRAAVDESVQEAVFHPGAAAISLPAGRYSVATPLAVRRGTLTITGASSGASIIDAGAVTRAFDVAPGAALTLRNLTITNGSSSVEGGSVRAFDAHITMEGVTISNSSAAGNGGAVFAAQSTVSIKDSTFDSNAGLAGGALSVIGGSVSVESSTFTRSSATDVGGAVSATSATALTIRASTFTGNASGRSGGALYIAGASVTPGAPSYIVADSTLSGNAALGGDGGAIATDAMVATAARATLKVTDCTMDNDQADGTGGAMAVSGALTQSGNSYTGNDARNGVADVAAAAGNQALH